eukprot:5041569-Amphidinium_carterae.1
MNLPHVICAIQHQQHSGANPAWVTKPSAIDLKCKGGGKMIATEHSPLTKPEFAMEQQLFPCQVENHHCPRHSTYNLDGNNVMAAR